MGMKWGNQCQIIIQCLDYPRDIYFGSGEGKHGAFRSETENRLKSSAELMASSPHEIHTHRPEAGWGLRTGNGGRLTEVDFEDWNRKRQWRIDSV